MALQENVRGFFSALGRVFAFVRIAVANVIVAVLVLLIAIAFASSPSAVEIGEETALLLRPVGVLVEQEAQVEALSGLVSGQTLAETTVGDVLEAIDSARDDDRITALVIDPTKLAYASTAHVNAIGDAIEEFKATGKPVIAFGEYFTQGQYFLASFADEVYMHPMGELLLTGFGAYQGYYQGLIEKLKVNVHVFRVGTYKAAVEPFTRSDMSIEAKQANKALIDQLWGNYTQRVSANRRLSTESLARYSTDFDTLLEQAHGDLARIALEHGLIDELLTPEELNQRLKQKVGEEDGYYRHVEMGTYLGDVRTPELPSAKDQIAVVIASGNILMGEQPRGSIGSDTLISLIRQARENDKIKALVLRVDSPGGSAFASELIRQELELLQTTGKPVIVSMAGAAASGGYWIAATADEIWAAPTTVTGSIGVFGILPTFEKSLASVGVARDGIGTGPLSGAMDPIGGINESMAKILQASVDFNYRRFIELVARGRDLETGVVDEIAQGRVWTGQDALERGLVDRLGHLNDAIAAAANLVDLEDYDVTHIRKPLSAQEQFIKQLSRNLGFQGFSTENPFGNLINQLAAQSLLRDLQWLSRLNDPKNIYAVCEICGSSRRF